MNLVALSLEEKTRLCQSLVIAEAIKSLGEVPSGHLYARVMGHMSLQQYNSIIDLLAKQKLIERSGHLLTWTGSDSEAKGGS